MVELYCSIFGGTYLVLFHPFVDKLTVTTWVCALVSAVLVGMCGVLPLLVNRWVRLDMGCRDSLTLKVVLSFAVGGLLGDVFLHLLPESWGSSGAPSTGLGLWVLGGLLTFLLVEKVVKCTEQKERDAQGSNPRPSCSNNSSLSGFTQHNGVAQCTSVGEGKNSELLSCKSIQSNGFTQHSGGIAQCSSVTEGTTWLDKDISGYLNLAANCTDNFTHGLAIAASYVASPAVGFLTTLAILCHEIPHEFGDFAILLNSGFSCEGAAKAQLVTSCWGLVGVVVGLTAEHISNSTGWLLPFTAGGFLYIALVSIVPSLLEDSSARQSIVQVLAMVVGIVVMALVTIVEKTSCAHMPPLS